MSTAASATESSRRRADFPAITARFVPRDDGRPGPRARVLVSGAGAREIDLTGNLTGAIAHALWQARGGDPAANWSDAERLIEQLAGEAARPPADASARESAGRPASPEVVVPPRRKAARR